MRVALLSDGWSNSLELRRCLLTAGHAMSYAETVRSLVTTLESDNFDVVVVSHAASDAGGLERVDQIRVQYRLTIPLMLVTPHEYEHYVVRALSAGADDYMVSPVRPREFLARVEALARRARHVAARHAPFHIGRLRVDLDTRRILLDGVPVSLTTKDFDLAVLFLQNIGRLMSRGRILQAVWGSKRIARSRTLDTHISRLRSKLELNESNGWRFSAVYRGGYRLERVQEEPVDSAGGLDPGKHP